MKASNLTPPNREKNSLYEIAWPYKWLHVETDGAGRKNMVVFFGTDFLNMGDIIDQREFIRVENECLAYLRTQYPKRRLMYKPHPAETSEAAMLDIRGFEVTGKDIIGEIFLPKHWNEIEAVFTMASTASCFARDLGLNSYVFLKIVEHAFDDITRAHQMNYFDTMPDNFFIRDLDRAPEPNAIVPVQDPLFEREFEKYIMPGTGAVWFSLCETKAIPPALSIAHFIREKHPEKKLNLVISKHSRWRSVSRTFLKQHFDGIFEFPRCFYSLRLGRLWEAIRTARKIKNMQITKDDLIVGFAPHDFVENCLVSLHPGTLKTTFISDSVFNIHYLASTNPLFSGKELRFDKGSYFFNTVLEPLLGLNRSLFLRYGSGTDHYISRPEKELNFIYDGVFICHAVAGKSA